jgi:transmembrane protein 216
VVPSFLQLIRFIQISFPVAFLYAFFLRLQTFVIVIEVIVNSIGIAFLVLEFLFSLFAYKRFKDYEKTQ